MGALPSLGGTRSTICGCWPRGFAATATKATRANAATASTRWRRTTSRWLKWTTMRRRRGGCGRTNSVIGWRDERVWHRWPAAAFSWCCWCSCWTFRWLRRSYDAGVFRCYFSTQRRWCVWFRMKTDWVVAGVEPRILLFHPLFKDLPNGYFSLSVNLIILCFFSFFLFHTTDSQPTSQISSVVQTCRVLLWVTTVSLPGWDVCSCTGSGEMIYRKKS